jgi:hypothetical protein
MKYFRKYEYATHRREGRAGAYEAAKPGGERRAETGRGYGEKGRPSEAKRGDTRRFASEVSRRARGTRLGGARGWVKESRLRVVYSSE